MTRRSSKQKSEQFRRMLRLALSISVVSSSALTVGPVLVWADSPDEVTTAESKSINLELPQFPFTDGPANKERPSDMPAAAGMNSAARIVLVQRWLGLGQRVDFVSHSESKNPDSFETSLVSAPFLPGDAQADLALPDASCLSNCEAMAIERSQSNSKTSESVVQQLPPMTIGSPSTSGFAATNGSLASEEPKVLVSKMVVTASATEQSGAVMESLSDKQEDSSLASGTVDPVDLMNSLDLGNSSEEDSSTSLNFSDQTAVATGPQVSTGNTPTENEPLKTREPQLVDSRRPMLLQTTSQSQSLSNGNSTEAKDQIITSAVPSKVTTSESGSVPTVQQAGLSSRRGFQPEPMKIQILGQSKEVSAETQSPIQRKPLVAMLASSPAASNPLSPESQANSLKELIHSDRADQGLPPTEPESNVEQLEAGESSPVQATPQIDAPVVDTKQHYVVGIREAVQLKCENIINGVSVEREEICQLIQTGSKSYSLVGLKEGASRIALITEVSGQPQIEVMQVTVGGRTEVGSSLESLAESMGHTIRQLYPMSRVAVEAQNQRIVVSGTVDSEESARKIIGLVRKTVLAPVVDQLTTY